VVLEKTLESPLDCKEIQPVHSEGDQPWDLANHKIVSREKFSELSSVHSLPNEGGIAGVYSKENRT